ncbi:hypothetical protein SATRM34S_04844 [Streptomyces atroolivaceus]
MSKRVLLPSLLGAAVIGAVTTEGLAMASTATEPTVKKESVQTSLPRAAVPGRSPSRRRCTMIRVSAASRSSCASTELDPAKAEMRDVMRHVPRHYRQHRSLCLLAEGHHRGGGRAGAGHLVHLDAGDGERRRHGVPAPRRHFGLSH